jgi:molybdenum cofactor biosynthesis enzyme MoaA
MCNIWAEREKFFLGAEEMRAAVLACRNAYGAVDAVSITGGECFLHPDIGGIIGMLVQLRQSGSINEFDIVSNGFFTERMQKVFQEHREPYASVPWSLAFSMDGLEERHCEQRGHPQSWQRITRCIAFLQAGFPNISLGVKFTATMLNYQDLYPLYAWCRERGLTFVPKIAEFNLGSYYHRGPGGIRIPPHAKEMLESVRRDLVRMMDEEATTDRRALQEIIHYIDTGAYSRTPCYTPLRSLFVDSRGGVYPCLYYKPIANIREPGWWTKLWSREHRDLVGLGATKSCVGCIAYHGFLKPYNTRKSAALPLAG